MGRLGPGWETPVLPTILLLGDENHHGPGEINVFCTLCIKNMTGLTAADIIANASNIRKSNQITLRAMITLPHLDDLAEGDGRTFNRLDALSTHF